MNDPNSDIDPLANGTAGCKFVRYPLTRYSAIRSEANLGAVTSGRPARTTPPPSRFSSVRRGVGEFDGRDQDRSANAARFALMRATASLVAWWFVKCSPFGVVRNTSAARLDASRP